MTDREINVVYDVEENSIAICYPEMVAVHKMRPESAEQFGRTIIKAVKALRRSKHHEARTRLQSRPGTRKKTKRAAITKVVREVDKPKGEAREHRGQEQQSGLEVDGATGSDGGSDNGGH